MSTAKQEILAQFNVRKLDNVSSPIRKQDGIFLSWCSFYTEARHLAGEITLMKFFFYDFNEIVNNFLFIRRKKLPQ